MRSVTGTEEESSKGRRRFIKKATVASSLFGIGAPRRILSNYRRETRIVTARGGANNDPRETQKVPKKWLKHENQMEGVVHELGPKLIEEEVVVSVCLAPSEKMIDGLHYQQLSISIEEGASSAVISQLPDTLEEAGISPPEGVVVSDIEKELVQPETELQCSGNRTEWPFPGGLFIEGDTGYEDDQGGTSGFRVHANDNEYLYTANHVASGFYFHSDCFFDKGNEVYASDGTQIGKVADGHKTHDWAVVGGKDIKN